MLQSTKSQRIGHDLATEQQHKGGPVVLIQFKCEHLRTRGSDELSPNLRVREDRMICLSFLSAFCSVQVFTGGMMPTHTGVCSLLYRIHQLELPLKTVSRNSV